jgi:signal transduction histidine kinase
LLLILLDNAIKFTGPGGEVSITLLTVGDRVTLTVSDTGAGIHADALPHIFQPFYTSAGSPSRAAAGAGIGLALAKWIAGAHGATISVASTPGRGSTFTVTMAAADPAVAAI